MAVHALIPELGRLRQEDHEFKVSLGYITRPCLKKVKKSRSLSMEAHICQVEECIDYVNPL
jgi:hypothetical protein